jgi:hypothetical protein
MLKSSLIADTVVTTLQSIPELVTSMVGDPARIKAYHFLAGMNKTLLQAINQMLQPSILVVCLPPIGGNFNGQTLFKHHVDVYVRMPNVATFADPISLAFEDIWWLICNTPVNGSDVPRLNIRYQNILPGQLDLMDTPSASMMTDEEGQDYLCGRFIFPEIGDQI